MPFEQVGDQKQIRVEQFRQLNEYINRLAAEAEQRRPPLPKGGVGALEKWKQVNRPLIEDAVGWPAPIPEYKPHVVSDEEIGSDELVRSIRRMTIRVAEGLDVYGILLLPHREYPKLMLCFHGGIGCPELVTSVCPSSNYNDGARRFVERGWAVFAPLFVLRREEEMMPDWPEGYRTSLHINALWAGTSLMAIELAKVERALQFFEAQPELDTSDVGVAGLSYGGYLALYAAALIPRLSFAVCSCSFNDRRHILSTKMDAQPDWRYPGAGELFGDAEVAALICPRPLYIEAGREDPLFPVETAAQEAARIEGVYADCGAADRFLFDPFDGAHEFGLKRIGEFMGKRI